QTPPPTAAPIEAVSAPTPTAPAPVIPRESAGPMPSPTPAPMPSPTRRPSGPRAPAIVSDTWLNTDGPLDWNSLRGKVVMVEFWTFGCINCRNVLPEFKGYHRDFAARGLVIVGAHSPEFGFEKELANVKTAVRELGIEFPVAIDNDFANWIRYNNRYWPTRYLIDKQGLLRYTHIGEGAYDETRAWIERLLGE
ncbi:MAG: redoxin domain-containing protein, partial [Thermoflexales bacterium]